VLYLNSKTLSLFFLFLIIFFETIFAEVTGVIEKEEVVVHFIGTFSPAAQEIADIYPKVKADLERTLGWKANFKPTILLIKDRKNFQRIVGNKLIVAYAVPKKGLIVIDYSKMKIHPFTVESLLKHELCHLLLHQYIKEDSLPKWLDEGIAQWVSNGIAEIIMDNRKSVLDKAILTGRNIPIRYLVDRFPEDKESLLLAYEESKSFVEYIRNNYGDEGIRRVLESLKDGKGIHEAIQEELSISLVRLEKEWLKDYNKWINWFKFLSSNLYEILFFLAALITILGFIRMLMKKREYKDEEW
jgi:hypothetical protein